MLSTGFLEPPQLSTPFPSNRRYWTCPKTGLIVPKWKDENIEWRQELSKKAEHDFLMQQELLAACKQSPLYWVNAFVWTYHQFETDPETGRQIPSTEPHQPMITWEIQDRLFNWLDEQFNTGEDGLIDKSREMGASWCCLEYLHWLWLFRADTEIREMSRVEDLVDSNLAKSLFWKHDYINSRLPKWMRPPGILERGRGNRTKMRIHNELNGSTIGGESTQKHAMRADRAAILLLDEFAMVDEGMAIRTSTADVAPCRIVNSTTRVGTEYCRWKQSGQIKVFSLMFWEHPEKGKGRFVLQDEVTKEYSISSPWLERQKERRTPREIATEILGQDLEAGESFFTLSVINKHAALNVRPAKERYNIDLKKGISNDVIPDILRRRDEKAYTIHRAKNGKLEIWGGLINGRPDQSRTYIFGIDTSKGQGASESVVSIKCKQTGHIIAKWKCRNTPPYEFARIIVGLALWVGGANPQKLPYLKWENNGPGWDLGRQLVKIFHYPFYYVSETVGGITDKKQKKYGFHVSRESKELLLRAYERALMQGKIINHDERGLEQAKYYIYWSNGSVGPAELTDKSAAEKLLHGDIVMADALTVEDKDVAKPKTTGQLTPYKSWGWRYEAWKKKKLRPKGWRKKFSFV
jgi:hypothetical protein